MAMTHEEFERLRKKIERMLDDADIHSVMTTDPENGTITIKVDVEQGELVA